MVLAQALQVILDAGDGIGQGIQALPVRHRLARQQLFLDIAVAGFQQGRGALQRDHRQAAADLGQQLRHAGQVLVVPLRGDELDDRVLGLLQTVARFLDHQLVDLRHIGGGQAAFLAVALVAGTGHAGQGGLDVEHAPATSIRIASLGSRRPWARAWMTSNWSRMTLRGWPKPSTARVSAICLSGARRASSSEGWPRSLRTNRSRLSLIRTSSSHKARPPNASRRGRVRRGGRARRPPSRGRAAPRRGGTVPSERGSAATAKALGHVEQQVLHQLVRRGLVQAVGALLDQALEFAVELRSRVRTEALLTTLPLARPSTRPEAMLHSGPSGASRHRPSRRA